MDGKRHYGDGLYQEAEKYLGVGYNELARFKRIAELFEIRQRCLNLNFGHHYEVASIKQTERADKIFQDDKSIDLYNKQLYYISMQPLTDKEIEAIGLQENPLLTAFINDTLEKAAEPVKEGKPKGDKIGFVREKIIAVILKGVTVLNMRQIADALNKSRYVVRFWNSQDQAFQDRAKQEKALFKKFIHTADDVKVEVLINKNIKADEREMGINKSLLSENKQLYQDDIAHIFKSYTDSTIKKINTLIDPKSWDSRITVAKMNLEAIQEEIANATRKKDAKKVTELKLVKLQIMDWLKFYTSLTELTK